MTDITYKGANCVTIQTKHSLFISDPVSVGLKLPKEAARARVVMVTQPQFNDSVSTPEQLVLSLPGEYEVGDCSITALAAESQLDPSRKATVFRIVTPEARIGLLGHINPDKVDEQLVENLGLVDILIVPVGGGGYTIDAHGAAKLVRRIDPRVVIPVHFREDGLTYEVPAASVGDFAHELSLQPQADVSYKLKQAGQIPETLTLVQLSVA